MAQRLKKGGWLTSQLPVAQALAPTFTSPLAPGSQFEGIDQGADYNQQSPYRAVAPGTVTAVTHGHWHGGTGDGTYIKLDKPVTVGGRTYSGVYYAEQTPLVQQGQHVTAGMPVMQGGGSELGFANGASPAATLSGGYNAEGGHTVSTQAGYDFNSLITGKAPQAAAPVTAALSGPRVAMPAVPANPQVQAPMTATPGRAPTGPKPLPAAVRAAIQILRA